jgi:N-formylglutamate deformylase
MGLLFDVQPPQGREGPVVVEIPHAGLTLDPESLSHCIAPAYALGQDADLFVDELYADAASLGASVLTARLSRYACDLNRAEDDLDSLTTPLGSSSSAPHGVVWRRTTSGRPALVAPLATMEIERRLSEIYRPYHRTLEQLLAEKEAKFGYAILLCAHSMPSTGRLGERRADVVPGTRGRTTAAPPILRAVETAAEAFGFDFAHDDPYRGGFTTGHHGRPRAGRHAIQVELARRTYMAEDSLRRASTFGHARSFCSKLVERLGELDPASLKPAPSG